MKHIQYKRKAFHPEAPEGKRNDFSTATRNYNQPEEIQLRVSVTLKKFCLVTKLSLHKP